MSEKKVIKDIGARPVKNSGRGRLKGDAHKGKYVIDIKEASKSFTLNEKVWAKICSDAMTYGSDKVPVLLVRFNSGVQLVIQDYDDSGVSDVVEE